MCPKTNGSMEDFLVIPCDETRNSCNDLERLTALSVNDCERWALPEFCSDYCGKGLVVNECDICCTLRIFVSPLILFASK